MKELIRTMKEHQGCQDYIYNFDIQINFKIAELGIEREDLQTTMAKVAPLKTTIRVLERSNKALATSNRVLITNNILFHEKIRQMTKKIEQVARYAERLQQ